MGPDKIQCPGSHKQKLRVVKFRASRRYEEAEPELTKPAMFRGISVMHHKPEEGTKPPDLLFHVQPIDNRSPHFVRKTIIILWYLEINLRIRIGSPGLLHQHLDACHISGLIVPGRNDQ